MFNFLKKIIGDKREWRKMEARAKALPADYQAVYGEIKGYLFKFSAGSGLDTMDVLRDLLGLFEEGAANRKGALEITGQDVATFCNELLKNTKTYTANWGADLNRNVAKKLGKEA